VGDRKGLGSPDPTCGGPTRPGQGEFRKKLGGTTEKRGPVASRMEKNDLPRARGTKSHGLNPPAHGSARIRGDPVANLRDEARARGPCCLGGDFAFARGPQWLSGPRLGAWPWRHSDYGDSCKPAAGKAPRHKLRGPRKGPNSRIGEPIILERGWACLGPAKNFDGRSADRGARPGGGPPAYLFPAFVFHQGPKGRGDSGGQDIASVRRPGTGSVPEGPDGGRGGKKPPRKARSEMRGSGASCPGAHRRAGPDGSGPTPKGEPSEGGGPGDEAPTPRARVCPGSSFPFE